MKADRYIIYSKCELSELLSNKYCPNNFAKQTITSKQTHCLSNVDTNQDLPDLSLSLEYEKRIWCHYFLIYLISILSLNLF